MKTRARKISVSQKANIKNTSGRLKQTVVARVPRNTRIRVKRT